MTYVCEDDDCRQAHYEPVSCPHCQAVVCTDCYLERHEGQCGDGACGLHHLSVRARLPRLQATS